MKLFKGVLMAMVAMSSMVAAMADLGPGSPPPAMEVKTWIKGSPVETFAPDKTYVVEFWATWCGPCKESIPHLTELAKKNPDVTFVGVSIWEDDPNKQVEKFVTDMGDKMNYVVGYSGNQEGMAKSWMKAAAQNGIPTAFLIKNQQIQWVGHPMELEKPLGEVKAGTFDLNAAKADFEKRANEAKMEMAAEAAVEESTAMYDAGKKAEAKKALTEAVAKYPKQADQADSIRFDWLAREDKKAWLAEAAKLSKSPDGVGKLTNFAEMQAGRPKGNLELGRKAMDYALKANQGKRIQILFDAYQFHNRTKDYKRAVEDLNQAIEVFPKSEFKDSPDLKAELVKARDEAQAKATASQAKKKG